MIVENVPSQFLLLEESMCVFSDDSRFIYMLMCWLKPLSISVYDTVYNKFVKLLPDKSVTDLLTRFNGFKEDTMRPSILFINNNTLLILFNEKHDGEHSGSVLLIVVGLNFCNNSFSIVDWKMIRDCHSEARLVKNGTQFLLVHTFTTDAEEFVNNNQFLAYFTFFLHDERILEVQEKRVVFDFDYEHSGRLATWYSCSNKLWCIRKVGRTLDHELLYFDLNESSPKETSIKIFERDETEIMFQWSSNNVLLVYYINMGEFVYLDLITSQWSRIFKRPELQKIENKIIEFKKFVRFDTYGSSNVFERHFDDAFNAFIFDKPKMQLLKVPFKTPPKLIDIAWTSVLNNKLLNELNKRNIIIYSQLF